MSVQIKAPQIQYTEEEIKAQLNERRPLPLGRKEWVEWVDRIYSGLAFEVSRESVEFVLADMILHLGPTEDFKEDGFFIHSLRKFAANQIAEQMRQEAKQRTTKRLAEKEAAEKEAAEKKEAESREALKDPKTWS